MGKPSVGSVVSHRRKSGWGLVTLPRAFSRSFSHWTRRWQFCSVSHCPRATAISSSCRATCSDRDRKEESASHCHTTPCSPRDPLQAPGNHWPLQQKPQRSQRSRSYRGSLRRSNPLDFLRGHPGPLGCTHWPPSAPRAPTSDAVAPAP